MSGYLNASNEIILPQASIEQSNDISPTHIQIKIVQKKFSPLKFQRDSERIKKANSTFRHFVKSTTNKLDYSNKTNHNFFKEFGVSYSKISNIEAKPGRYHLMLSRNCSLPTIIQKRNLKKRKSDYKNVEELISEINVISNQNKKENYSSLEMKKIENSINEIGVNTKRLLKNRDYSDSHWRFGIFSSKKNA